MTETALCCCISTNLRVSRRVAITSTSSVSDTNVKFIREVCGAPLSSSRQLRWHKVVAASNALTSSGSGGMWSVDDCGDDSKCPN
eukprot:CAMPEP_0180157724 /NCGR_PEP_ID=MMETSP0986-20121125/26428_2 /TAXON_ID=697907 /ORGANISM="non described non described, Strain CCMP2293" /LENGTH=84 /DNA_ID=CAMNT_0022107331 /DNA_START=324 /DNA_END=578 /DNA_ORIENTATION=-